MTTHTLKPFIDHTHEQVELWKNLAELARWQQKAVGHWQGMLGWPGLFSSGAQLAPVNLSQHINPWNVSLFQVISGTRGDPQTEVDILTRVASYGSQLGTVIDALQAILPEDGERKLLDFDARDAIRKLERLAHDIERVKQG